MKTYLDASEDAGKEFYQTFHDQGKIVMLNLLRYKKIADYAGYESLNPDEPITGKQAYKIYIDHTLPLLEAAGAKLLFWGVSQSFLIGPKEEKWDEILLVEHQSVNHFMQFAQQPGYLKIAGHRMAALEDSRLLPSGRFHQESVF